MGSEKKAQYKLVDELAIKIDRDDVNIRVQTSSREEVLRILKRIHRKLSKNENSQLEKIIYPKTFTLFCYEAPKRPIRYICTPRTISEKELFWYIDECLDKL